MDDDMTVAFKKASAGFKEMARTHHPDRTNDKEKIDFFQQAKEVYEKQNEANKILNTLDTYNGTAYPDLVKYGRNGENLRRRFYEEFDKAYPRTKFAGRSKEINEANEHAEIFAKDQATYNANKDTEKGYL